MKEARIGKAGPWIANGMSVYNIRQAYAFAKSFRTAHYGTCSKVTRADSGKYVVHIRTRAVEERNGEFQYVGPKKVAPKKVAA